jgi:ribonuclease R
MAKFGKRSGSSKGKGGRGDGGGSSGGGRADRGGRGNSGAGSDGGKASGHGSGSGSGSSGGGNRGKNRNIKNARSLADVLGGGKSRPAAGHGGFSRGPGASRPDAAPDKRHSFNQKAERDERGAGREPDAEPRKGAVSRMLTYIMTFTPPGADKTDPPKRVDVEVSKPKASPSREAFLAKDRGGDTRKREDDRKRGNDNRKSNQGGRPKREEREEREERGARGTQRGTSKQPSRPDGSSGRRERDERPSRERVREPERPKRPGSSWPQARVQPAAGTGDVRKGRAGRPDARSVSGLIKRHPDGFGFLIPDQPGTPDVYVARQSMTGIMTNDKVEVELYRPRSGGKNKEERLSGEITRVLSRANSRVVGRYLPVDKKYGMLQDENRGWGADLRIAADDSMDAKEGDLVAVEITQYPDDEHEFTGKVVSIIGDSDDPINDVIRVVHQAGIPNEFSQQAVADAQKFGGKVTDQERRGREDLTQHPLITIDGVTAKDFDDAIYTRQTARGFNLIVAIADVSHYVKPGTRLDEEAYERGTSTYFPNYVVPMLPEELSNELCSLKPNVPRLCFCCEMNINFNGDLQDYRFFEGVMQSQARVTYGEAQELIDAYDSGEENKNKTAKKLAHVSDNILKSRDLAKILMQKRFRDGSLDLEIPETQVVVDSTGESTDIIRASRIFAHRLIEELMLITNICTARFMDESNIPGIYRIHEEPNADKIADLQRFLWNMTGSRTSMGGAGLAKKLTAALESVSGKPEAQVLNILTLRTMQQAQYSEQNVGHFGLGFSHYSHFTSPIRRYPDLIAHRLIKSVLYDRYSGMKMEADEIASATTWLSACEQRSTKAERKVISIKKARFIRRFEGEEFDGMVSSVAKFGIFVLLRQYDVDGLVKIERLGNDRFEFDEENLVLRGRKSGLEYTIGDEVRVRVMSADVETGKIDFELADLPSAKSKNSEDEDQTATDEFGESAGKGRGKRGANEKEKRHSKRGGEKNVSKHAKGRSESKPEKRGKSENDSRGVRKERVSKRRGKN